MCGKGGVGRSTVAAALAVVSVGRGARTVVAEVGRRADVRHVVHAAGADHVSIDPEEAMEEYLVDQLPVKALADVLTSSRTFTYLAAATPGMRELLTAGKVWELAQVQRRTPGARPYDRVIVDAPATGHGVAVLAAPRTFSDAARLGPVARQGAIIHDMLSDPGRTSVVAVCTPEELPINETLALRERVHDAVGLELSAVVVNAVRPRRFTRADAEVLEAAPASFAVRAARTDVTRGRAQQAQLARLRRELDGEVPVVTLPLHVAGPDVDGLARRLERCP